MCRFFLVFTNKRYVKQIRKTHAQVMKVKALEGRVGGGLLRKYNKKFFQELFFGFYEQIVRRTGQRNMGK